jgi:spiro-SPASM protein
MTEVKKKNVAYVDADLERSGLGGRSRVADVLAGTPVLRRTLSRLKKAQRLDAVLVFCPAGQREAMQRLAGGLADEVIGLNESPSIDAVIRRRKWALSSWRGGLGEATVFDELPITNEIVQNLKVREFYTALPIHAEAVAVDPVLLDGLIEHHRRFDDQMRFTFSHAAPGLVGCAYRLDLLHEAAMTKSHIGDVLAYDPDSPHMDLINETCCFEAPQSLSFSEFRYIADARRNFDILAEVFSNGPAKSGDDFSSMEIVEAVNRLLSRVRPLPRELEIEITTDSSLRIEGYPHRNSQGNRGLMSLDQFRKIVNDCRDYDDLCLTFGGCGEPLAHPHLIEMIETAKKAGFFGINIETDGLRLHGELAQRLAKSPADVISVFMDADSEEGYRKAKGQAGFDDLIRRIEEFIKISRTAGGPVVVPHLVKTHATMGEMEGFYDRWLRRCGAAVIVGYNDYAGQIENRAVMDMSPPKRSPCGRLGRTMAIHADGRATTCSQDYQGKYAIGNVFEQSVGELWQGTGLESLRNAHNEGRFDENPLCAKCKDWHR